MTEALRRLTRSRHDRVFAGVCGGLASYMSVDPVLVRGVYILLTLLSNGAGIIVYLIAWLIMPNEKIAVTGDTSAAAPVSGSVSLIVGLFVLAIGAAALAGSFVPGFRFWTHWTLLGPLALIVCGVIVLLWRPAPRAATKRATATKEGDMADHQADSTTTQAEPRRLVRVEEGRLVAGICTGLGRYFGVDPVIVRLLWIALVLMAGTGILLYLIGWVVIPRESEIRHSTGH